jgi:hypothetical protein
MLWHSSIQIVPRYAQVLDQNRRSNEEMNPQAVVHFQMEPVRPPAELARKPPDRTKPE